MSGESTRWSRRTFAALLGGTAISSLGRAPASSFWSGIDTRVQQVIDRTIGVDTHNHIDLPMTEAEMPDPDIDLRGEIGRSGLGAICATFATDYEGGDPYRRFLFWFAAMDRQLQKNGMHRSLTAEDVKAVHGAGQPAPIQAVEGAHFLEGKLERVEEAYHRGLRHFGLLHDSDASVPLGDVYTNPPTFGGLTAFGVAVIRECNRLGMLIDLAHADEHTTAMALKRSTRPVIVSHTGLDTQLGSNSRMAQMMRPRLISRAQAKEVASSGGAVGVWTHLSDTPLEYAQNLRALVEVIGVDHVCIGTDTKLTRPAPRRGPVGPPPGQGHSAEEQGGKPPFGGPRPGGTRIGERTNEAWAGQTLGFYPAVIEAMLATGFSQEEIGSICGGNYLRIFGQAVHA